MIIDTDLIIIAMAGGYIGSMTVFGILSIFYVSDKIAKKFKRKKDA